MGFEPTVAIDVNPLAIEAYSLNGLGHGMIRDLRKPGSLPNVLKDLDVLVAGPPCQGFSTAGKNSQKDPRNDLLPLAARLAADLRAGVIVLENVPGVRSGRHRHYWADARSILRLSGYRTSEALISVQHLGMAQLRKRLILVAWRTQGELNLDPPDVNPGNLRSALVNVEHAPDHMPSPLPPDSAIAKIARRIAPGQKLSNVREGCASVHTWEIPEVFGDVNNDERVILSTLLRERRRRRVRSFGDADPVDPNRLTARCEHIDVGGTLAALEAKGYVKHVDRQGWDLTRTFNGKFRRLQWDRPAPTVHTKFGDPRYFLHPDEERGFSVREAARIQGFPDTFTFTGSVREKFAQIGNAVPPPLAAWIGKIIRQRLL